MAAVRTLLKPSRLWRTVRDLKLRMIGYRFWHRLPSRKVVPIPEQALAIAESWPVTFFPLLPTPDQLRPEPKTFEALNLPPVEVAEPTWTGTRNGLLWTYHLNSLTWLERFPERHPKVDALLVQRAGLPVHNYADAPYPQSLRIQSVIRYLLRSKVREPELLVWLWRDYQQVRRFPEWHLDGNHLLENLLSAYSGALFFGDVSGKAAIEKTLSTTLQEQFLPDGAHYERSIHYTAQLTASMLKTLGLAQLTGNASNTLVSQLKQIIARALGWIAALQFSDGSFPAFGDSFPQLSPSLDQLHQSAGALGILPQVNSLDASGYRRLRNEVFDCIVNAGNPEPRHQPGHAHADTTSFCLHVNGQPLVVDTGISTYERNVRRLTERKTAAHNVLQPPGEDSAEVWAAFRMGRKPTVSLLADTSTHLKIQHTGFRKKGLLVSRTFDLGADCLTLTEAVSEMGSPLESRLHFHPDVMLNQIDAHTVVAEGFNLQLRFSGFETVTLFTYDWNAGFNLRRPAAGVVATTQQSGAVITFQLLSPSFTL